MPETEPAQAAAPVTCGEIMLPAFSARYADRAGRLAVRYRCTGPQTLPAVAVLGGISANAAVTAQPDGSPGWWSDQVGPGLGVDTRRYRVLSFDYVTSRSLEDARWRAVSTDDQADALAGLLNALGIRRLHAVIGASYGAMVGLSFAARHGPRTRQLVAISGAHRAHPYATALRGIQRRIIRESGAAGLALARSLALTTYLTPALFAERFGDAPRVDADGAHFPVDDYLAYNGRKYAAEASAADYLDLSESLDLHTVVPERITLPVTLIAADPDQLVPVSDLRELAERLAGPTRLHVLASRHGHDAFLKEHEALSPLLRLALQETSQESCCNES